MDGSTAKCILILEDEPSVIEFLKEFLTGNGFVVDTASNGMEGLKKAISRDYSLIITDINLPHLNGIDFYLELKKRIPHIKDRIVFITGYLNCKYRTLLEEEGLPVLLKPFKISRLKEIIDSIV